VALRLDVSKPHSSGNSQPKGPRTGREGNRQRPGLFHSTIFSKSTAMKSSNTSAHFPQTVSPATTRFGATALLGLLLISGASPVRAQETLVASAQQPVSVQQVDATRFRIRVANPELKAGQVQVVSLQTGHTLFAEAYKEQAYGHRFDFRDLRQGRYALVVKQGGRQHRYVIKVQDLAGDKRQVALRSVELELPEAGVTAAAL
jgi:hypothetical protein